MSKPFDLQLDPPTSPNPPLCKIIQEGKDSITTTDFYLTNIEPKPWVLPSPLENKDTSENSGATATNKPIPHIEPDPLQPGEIRLHAWMLGTPQAPILNLKDENITSQLDLRDTFHRLHLCPEEDQTKPEECPNGRRKAKKPRKSQ